eukprot:m.340007 g.340007  ORF g.340007 m.340007 type:complete len:164 (+) comp16098_c0_seq6:275-766(+)
MVVFADMLMYRSMFCLFLVRSMRVSVPHSLAHKNVLCIEAIDLYWCILRICAVLPQEKLIGRMAAIHRSLQVDLDAAQQRQDMQQFDLDSAHQFASASEELIEIYTKEHAVKQAILSDIHSAGDDLTTMYMSAWKEQPFLCTTEGVIARQIISTAASAAAASA